MEKANIERNINLVDEKLSNISKTLPKVLLFFCNISSYWQRGDFSTRQKLQKMLFTAPICYDKVTGDYRTLEVNALAEIIRSIATNYEDGQTKSDCDFTHQSLDVEGTQSLSNEFVRQYIGLICFIDTNLAVFGVLG